MLSLISAIAGLLISISSLGLSVSRAAQAGPPGICEREMGKAAARYQVPLGVLYAVALTETGVKGKLHPYALNVAGKTILTETPDAAMARFHTSRKAGIRLIDLGCMQVNHYYHGAEFSSVEEMLIPERNVDYAARFLSQLRQQEGSWTMAVARYHAGPGNNPAQKRYVCTVIGNLIATGFGRWTDQARRYCK